jgi:hypothetical protein
VDTVKEQGTSHGVETEQQKKTPHQTVHLEEAILNNYYEDRLVYPKSALKRIKIVPKKDLPCAEKIR